MSDGINKVMLGGTLGADPDLRHTQSGQAVLNMRLATNESWLDKDKVRQERTEWHSVVIFGARAEALAKILRKGAFLFVDGSLRTESYEKDGVTRYKTEVIARDVILPPRARGDGEQASGDHAGRPAARTASPASAPRAPAGKSAGDFVVPFGRDQGKKISQVEDLTWLRGACERDLADPEKARFHDQARERLVAIDAEMEKRKGGGAYAVAPEPEDGGGYGGGGYGTDDIPFASCAPDLDLRWMVGGSRREPV